MTNTFMSNLRGAPPPPPPSDDDSSDVTFDVGDVKALHVTEARDIHLPDGNILHFGANHAPSDWAKMLKNPGVQVLLQAGWIVESEDPPPEGTPQLAVTPHDVSRGFRPKNLQELPENRALQYVRFETNVDRLREWSSDNRPAVQAAIAKRLDSLK